MSHLEQGDFYKLIDSNLSRQQFSVFFRRGRVDLDPELEPAGKTNSLYFAMYRIPAFNLSPGN